MIDNPNELVLDRVDETQVARACFMLRKLLVARPDFAAHHTWLYETDRWVELVYALLSRVFPEERINVRAVVGRLQSLGLLDRETLIAASHESESRVQFFEILREANFTEEEALRALEIVVEAAVKIDEQFEGKLQLFLRNNADLMVRQLVEQLQLSTCNASEAEEAFSLWLQNVCSMPVSLFDRHMAEFCHRYGFTLSTLVAAADKLDLNLALVDDLVRGHFEDGR